MSTLFRGYCKEYKKWVYGSLLHYYDQDTGDGILRTVYVITRQPQWSHDEPDWEVVPESIGQYIGLSDQNEIMMFTGDIITHDGFYHPSHPEFHMLIPSIFDIFNDNWDYDIESLRSKDCIKIIGNFYENPELMERK